MDLFERKYEEWMETQIRSEKNSRRRGLLEKGLSHGTKTYLSSIWFSAIGNFDHLYAEWEVRDLHNKIRYIDLAYRPGMAKGSIEIQDYASHARDIDVRRFKDLCHKQALLTLSGWTFLPIAYLSIKEEPEICKQLTLSFVGRFMASSVPLGLHWAEAEAIRFARRRLLPFKPSELAEHLRLSDRQTRRILHRLVENHLLTVTSGIERYRMYQIRLDSIG